MERMYCGQGYLVSAWALSWVQTGCKSKEKWVSLLYVSTVCHICPSTCSPSPCLTSWLKIRSLARWYSSSLSSIDLLCFSRKGWSRFYRKRQTRTGQNSDRIRSMSIIEEAPQRQAAIEIWARTDLVVWAVVSLQNDFPPVDLFCLVLMHLVQKPLLWSWRQTSNNRCYFTVASQQNEVQRHFCAGLHASAAGPVDDDRFARLVYIVLHAKVGRHPMDQHTVVGRHVRKLLKGTEA